MRLIRSNTRLFALIASFAIMASALAPTAMRMLAAALAGPIVLAEVCSAGGVSSALVVADADSGGSRQPAGGTSIQRASDCPYCAPHAFSFGMPPAIGPAVVLQVVSDVPPRRFLESHRPLFAWSASAPRGPPLES